MEIICKGPKSKESNVIDGTARSSMFKTINFTKEMHIQTPSNSQFFGNWNKWERITESEIKENNISQI